jgi:hypothetical protein
MHQQELLSFYFSYFVLENTNIKILYVRMQCSDDMTSYQNGARARYFSKS